jgi:hypothetical protein
MIIEQPVTKYVWIDREAAARGEPCIVAAIKLDSVPGGYAVILRTNKLTFGNTVLVCGEEPLRPQGPSIWLEISEDVII